MQIVRFYYPENKIKRLIWNLFEFLTLTKQDEEQYRQHVEEQENLIVIPTHCPVCKSANIMGRGDIIGIGYINLETLQVDEPSGDFEVYDLDEIEFHCSDCDHFWENVS